MRPRQVCRGKAGTALRSVILKLGFNEAPASLPGKGDILRCGARGAARFNEAPASLPGKVGGPREELPRAAHASMRPRQVCRGKTPGSEKLAHIRERLQ